MMPEQSLSSLNAPMHSPHPNTEALAMTTPPPQPKATDFLFAMQEDETGDSLRPRFDEMLNQLSAHTGLFSRTTFQNIFSSLIRMVRDQQLNGAVILRTHKNKTFDMLAMPLYNVLGLDVFSLDQGDEALPDHIISPTVGFMLLISDRLSVAIHWNSETAQAFRMDQGGWSFHPGDVRNLALHLAEWLGHHAMHAAIQHAPVEKYHDDKLSLIVSSLLSNLENRNRELTLALEREKDLARRMAEQERMAAIGQMSSVIAHEIRNPLGLISLYAQIVHSQLEKLPNPEDVPEMLYKNLGQIQQATDDLEGILTELTQYARPFELNKMPLNMCQFVENVCEFYRPKYDEKGVQLVVEMQVHLDGDPNHCLTLEVDEGRLRQALINLLKNALEATPKGKKVSVALSCRRDDSDLFIKVKDEGCGVPLDKREKLFTPYFTTKATGTGLGLAFVRKVMQGHGGSAELLWNEPTKGCTMGLLLPLNRV
jgi:signal transduction histidine kinase